MSLPFQRLRTITVLFEQFIQPRLFFVRQTECEYTMGIGAFGQHIEQVVIESRVINCGHEGLRGVRRVQ
jgi:hypothetical protein